MNPHPNFTTEELHIVDMHIKSSNSLVHKIMQIKMRFNFYPLDYYFLNSSMAYKSPKTQNN